MPSQGVFSMRLRIGVLLSVAALAAVGVAAGPASAESPTCPPGTGFTAAISHPGYPTSVSHGGQQNPAFENAFHAPGGPYVNRNRKVQSFQEPNSAEVGVFRRP